MRRGAFAPPVSRGATERGAACGFAAGRSTRGAGEAGAACGAPALRRTTGPARDDFRSRPGSSPLGVGPRWVDRFSTAGLTRRASAGESSACRRPLVTVRGLQPLYHFDRPAFSLLAPASRDPSASPRSIARASPRRIALRTAGTPAVPPVHRARGCRSITSPGPAFGPPLLAPLLGPSAHPARSAAPHRGNRAPHCGYARCPPGPPCAGFAAALSLVPGRSGLAAG